MRLAGGDSSRRATTDDLQGLLLQVVFALLMVFMIAYFIFVETSKKERAEEILEVNRQKLVLALEKVADAFSEAGLNLAACCPSPISGHKGNTEFLLMGTGKPMPAGELDLKAVALRGEVCTLFSA